MNFLVAPAIGSIIDIPWTLIELKHNVTIFDKASFDPNVSIPEDNALFFDAIKDSDYHYVISHLFIPAISDICYEVGVPYISWTYDSPLVSLFTKSVFHPTNYTFIFDYEEYLRLKTIGAPNVYHMPLAVNINRTGALDISPEDEQLYSHDISFVGNLYEDNLYNEIIQYLPEELQLAQKLYLMKHMCQWHTTRPWPAVSEQTVSFIKNRFHADAWNQADYLEDSTYFGFILLLRKLGEIERITTLNALADRFSVNLYTSSNTDFLQNVSVHKSIDYYTLANKVFHLSKINLNITLPSIETGVPQRVFDIMGAGGFVMTNYQKELDDLFVIGKEIEVFHSIDELIDKCTYYLTHEKDRLTIAMNGYKKVRDHYTYPQQLQKILSIVQGTGTD